MFNISREYNDFDISNFQVSTFQFSHLKALQSKFGLDFGYRIIT